MKKNSFTPEEIKQIAELRKAGMSCKDISIALKRSSTGTWYQVQKLEGKKTTEQKDAQKALNAKLKTMFDAGFADDQISAELGIAENTVRHKRSVMGLRRRRAATPEVVRLGENITGHRRKVLCGAWV